MSAKNENGFKALVVEDQELFRDAVVDELSFYGFQSATAVDGEEGLKAAINSNFDVILSDMRMPNKDGKWFLSELRKTKKSAPPFIFMTGFTDLAPQDAFAMGADGFLGKPIDSDRLNATVTKVCKPLESRWTTPSTAEPVQTFTNAFTCINDGAAHPYVLLGRGGMFMATEDTPLRPGDHVHFNLSFRDGPIRVLKGSGRIVWKRDASLDPRSSGYGIDFEFLSPESQLGWLTHLKSQEIVPFVPKGQNVSF